MRSWPFGYKLLMFHQLLMKSVIDESKRKLGGISQQLKSPLKGHKQVVLVVVFEQYGQQ